jgi:hypothetical protein
MRDSTSNRGRRLLAAALLLWLAAGLAAYLGRRYLYNVLLGPFPVARADLLALADPGGRTEYFVSVDGDDVELLFPRAYTGGKEPYSMYGLLRVGEKWLLLRVPAAHKGRRLTGTLEGLSDYERQDIVTRQHRACLPFRLEATRYFRTVGWLTAVLPLGALMLLAAALTVGSVRAASRGRQPPEGEIASPPGADAPGSPETVVNASA